MLSKEEIRNKVWNKVFPFETGDRVGFYSVAPKTGEKMLHKGTLRLKLLWTLRGVWRVELDSDKLYWNGCFVHIYESRLFKLERQE